MWRLIGITLPQYNDWEKEKQIIKTLLQNNEIEYFHNDPSNPWNISNTLDAFYVAQEGVVWESTTRRGVDKLELLKEEWH